MDLVQPNEPFCFNYTDFGQSNSLFVRAAIYDVTSGTAVFVENVVMSAIDLGLYTGNFTGEEGKTYLVISLIYTDATYTTPMPNRAPASHCFQVMGTEVTFFGFSWGAFNQLEDLFVAGSIYDLTSGTATFIEQNAMAHVANGIYFGSYLGLIPKTYQVLQAVYTDNTFTTPETFYAPGGDSFQAIDGGGEVSTDPGEENVRFGIEYIINGEDKVGTLNVTPIELVCEAVLIGATLGATVLGELNEADLSGEVTDADLMGEANEAVQTGQSVNGLLIGECCND